MNGGEDRAEDTGDEGDGDTDGGEKDGDLRRVAKLRGDGEEVGEEGGEAGAEQGDGGGNEQRNQSAAPMARLAAGSSCSAWALET